MWVSHVTQMGLRYKHECVWPQAALGPLLEGRAISQPTPLHLQKAGVGTSVKGPDSKYFWLRRPTVFAMTTQLCYAKAALDKS